jgi:hypothetical protein
MLRALTDAGGPMTARQLADFINQRGLYSRRDGTKVPANQISARANRYKHLFVRTARGLALRRRE